MTSRNYSGTTASKRVASSASRRSSVVLNHASGLLARCSRCLRRTAVRWAINAALRTTPYNQGKICSGSVVCRQNRSEPYNGGLPASNLMAAFIHGTMLNPVVDWPVLVFVPFTKDF